MATAVTWFRNRDNYAKFQLFHYESGASVIIQILSWLYQGQSSIECHLFDLIQAKKFPVNGTEKETFEELKNGNIRLSELDLTLLYRITQAVCGQLVNRNDEVWTKRCPAAKQDELEYLLFRLKNGRNNVAHPGPKVKNITDSDVADKAEEMKLLLTSILRKAGHKGNVDAQEVSDAVNFIQNDIDRICNDDKTDVSMKPHILNIILNDLKFSYEDELKSSFDSELKGYSAPYLHAQDFQKTTIPLRDLLTFDDSQVTVIQGEAGEGKTALTRVLFYSWMAGLANSVKKLSTFEVVVRVECRHVSSRDVSLFLEDLFPIASYSFSNTSSFKRHLDEYRIIWIMDGFDECTAEFKSFLQVLTKRLPEGHRLVITTRPYAYKELEKYLSNLIMASLSLELLGDNNIEEITSTLITDGDKRKAFSDEFYTLDESAATLLRTPLNMILFVELWLEDPNQARGTYTSKTLFVKTTKLQLRRLEKRLEERTHLPSEDLTRKLEKWFYGSLCRQSFIMAMGWSCNITSATIERLKEEADEYLISSYCLSTFLVETKGREKTCQYDFRHSIQQYVLASLFISEWNKYNVSTVTENLKNVKTFPVVKLLYFYIRIAIENDSINSNTIQVFNPIRDLISTFKLKEQCIIWCSISVASKFNKKFMKRVSQAFKHIPYVDTANVFSSYTEVATFVKFVHPKEIRLTVKNYLTLELRRQLLDLLNELMESPIEIHLRTVFDNLPDIIGTSAIDKINESTSNITKLIGTMDVLPLLSNHYANFKAVELVIYSIEELLRLRDFLHMKGKLNDIKIVIIFDEFPLLEDVNLLPIELIGHTTLVFRLVKEDNFSDFMRFVSQLKCDKDLKLNSIIYCMERHKLNYKQQLHELASVVVPEKYSYLRRLPKRAEFIMYTSTWEEDETYNWMHYEDELA